MKLTFVGNLKNLSDNDLMEMSQDTNLNSLSRNEVNLELIKRLPLKPKMD